MSKRKRKRIARKIKRFILKGFTFFMFVVFILSVCAIDSDTWLFTITTAISGGWLALFAWANNWFYEEGGEG